MGEQEKFARMVEIKGEKSTHFDIFVGNRRVASIGATYKARGVEMTDEINKDYAQSIARFRERCKEALREKASFGSPHRNPSDADKHWKQGVHAALKAIDEVPL